MSNRPIREVAKRQERRDIEAQMQEFFAKGGAVKECDITDRSKRNSERYMLRRYPEARA